MDHIDRLYAEADDRERGPDLTTRPDVPPEMHAGNRLSVALDAAEKSLGPHVVAELLHRILTGRPYGVQGGVLTTLIEALERFRSTVNPAAFCERLRNRLHRLQEPHAPPT